MQNIRSHMLNRLNSEIQLRKAQNNQCNNPVIHGTWSNDVTNQSNGFETFRTHNVAISKRMSVGVGADCFILPDPNFDSDQFAELFYDEGKKRPKDWNEDSMNKKQKRHTTLSFFDYIFEQNGEPKTSTVSGSKTIKELMECIDSDEDDYGVVVEDASDDSESEAESESFCDYVFQEDGEPKTSKVIEQSKEVKNRVEYTDSDDDGYGVIVEDVSDDLESELRVDDDEPKMAPEEAKKHLVLFDGTMEQSQESYQQIHDWDRKMGLKRSHSKAMRLSSRSRKQLRQFTQKEITRIIHL